MILIVGLGNPESEYRGTRHNLGFCLINKLAEKNDFPDFKLDKKANALITKKDDIVLAKPQTFMNDSGRAVKKLLTEFKIPLSRLLVIHDEADLKLGEARISKNRSSAGHKGVQSLIDELKSKDFIRVRVGIKSEDENFQNKNLEQIVLEKFTPAEKETLKQKTEDILKTIEKAIKINEE